MAKRGRPRKVESLCETVTSGSSSTATLEAAPLQSVGFDLVLGIRRLRGGNFSGLWELSELSVDADQQVCAVKILTDANIKPIVLAKVGRRLNECF